VALWTDKQLAELYDLDVFAPPHIPYLFSHASYGVETHGVEIFASDEHTAISLCSRVCLFCPPYKEVGRGLD